MAIRLSNEAKKRSIASIKQYFAENMEEEVGDLKATLLLEFCLKEIGPSIYNQAVADAQAWMQDKLTDLDGSCHEPEFEYWKK